MGRLTKFLFYLILTTAALVIITVALAPLVPLGALEPAVESRLSDMLGRKVTVDSLRLNLMGDAYFTITGMTAEEDPAFGEGTFLKADQVRADIDLFQYLRTRKIAIEAINITTAELHLVRSVDGSWNWTTLGQQSSRPESASLFIQRTVADSGLTVLLAGGLSAESLKKVKIDNASVRWTDRKPSAATEAVYKGIRLDASLTPATDGGDGRQATGEFIAQSEEDGEAEMLRATFPFDLKIKRGSAGSLLVDGLVGPGPLETKNLSVGSFAVNGQISAERSAPLTGSGQLSATEMVIRPINVSQQVAGALRVNQIGDMNPGTMVAGLQSEFRISQGAVETTGLRIREIDGLGDAIAQSGSFKIDSGLSVNYAATITLSPDATSRVKAANSMLGIIATVLETNNQLSVPINIDGDVRNPRVYVDVSRIF
jgi:uncharacterized protein involved in outer membrane biogenesis